MTTKTDAAPERSLHRKLAQVMYEAERIPKRGKAPAAMGGFAFVQVGDAADVIRKALAEHNVSMIPTAIELIGEAEHATSSGKMMTTVTVRTTWTLTDGDSGESTVIQSMGSGADMGDKAVPKAQSNAMKYALLMGFLLSTGDDPEQTDTSDRRQQREPQRPVGQHDAPPDRPELDRPVDGLIGTAEVGKTRDSDFELRETPDGWALGFRLTQGRTGFKVLTFDALAQALATLRPTLEGQRVTVWGAMVDEHFTNAKGVDITYKVVHADRVATPDGIIPAPDGDGPVEAPSETLPWAPLDEDEKALIGAGLPE